MITLLSIIGCIVAFFIFPFATVFGLIGVWAFGFWGCLIGVVVGLLVQNS
jgi:hypothetical protein